MIVSGIFTCLFGLGRYFEVHAIAYYIFVQVTKSPQALIEVIIFFSNRPIYDKSIAGLYCWIAQSGLQSNLVDCIVIDNPKSKSDLDFQSSFVISIQI